MKNIYRQIAEENRITPKEIEACMRSALKAAWENAQKDSSAKALQAQIPCKGDMPTNEEFILYVVDMLSKG